MRADSPGSGGGMRLLCYPSASGEAVSGMMRERALTPATVDQRIALITRSVSKPSDTSKVLLPQRASFSVKSMVKISVRFARPRIGHVSMAEILS